MSNILITGRSGFLGKILDKRLKELGTYTDELSFNGNKVDIKKPFNLPDKFFDIVIHAAGKAHSVPKTLEEGEEFIDVNLQGTKNLCQAIDHLSVKPKAFIFISTVAVYGIDGGSEVDENHPLEGITPYAKSKILAEKFLTTWAETNGIVLGVLRLPLIVGPNPPGNLGAMISGIKTGKYLSIGKAEAKKSMVYAQDIASVIFKISEKGGVYNLTDGYHPSFNELELAISSSLNKRRPKKIPFFFAKIFAGIGDVLGSNAPINSNKLNKILSTLTFDDSKARNELEWNPTKVLNVIDEII